MYKIKEEFNMKCKVRLTHTVEMYVEGESEEAIMDWLLCTTPAASYGRSQRHHVGHR